MLLLGSYDRTVRCWDFDSGECVRTFCGHQRAVFSIVYIPSDDCCDSRPDEPDNPSSAQVLFGTFFALRHSGEVPYGFAPGFQYLNTKIHAIS